MLQPILSKNVVYLRLRNLAYKTAIVTGSGRGIGKETAVLLSKVGMNVVICSRTQK
jgi:NAD(P)-dependent dehydrogenase (short-subunit alcohol dehydrogenase family)